MLGAEIFIESLLAEGVDTIFGHPGGAILPINDALYSGRIRHILTRHEQGAVHMAEGYARATGRPGVVLVTSGPGGTNVVTGLTDAFMDSTPIVVFTGQVPTGVIGNDAFQEADIVGMTRSCTKHNYLVRDVRDLARTIKEAFHIAATGRPGPVLVDIPKDVASDEAAFSYPDKVDIRGYKPRTLGHAGQIRRAAEMLAAAERPVIYAGGGVIHSEAAPELYELGELTATPVTNTLMGLGGFPGRHQLWLGMLGMHGTYTANMAMDHADLVIAVGARFDDRVTGNLEEFCVGAEFIHIDIDPSSIGKNIPVALPIVGDVKMCLQRLNQELRAMDGKDWRQAHAAWLDRVATWQRDFPLTYDQEPDGELLPQYVCEQIYEVTDGDAIITTEVGQHQMWAAQFYHFTKPRRFITSGGLGTMGYGFPAAIGAQIAYPDRRRDRHRRRRQLPDERPGAGHRGAVRPAGHRGDPEQPQPGHGAPVAAVLLRWPLRGYQPRGEPRLRQARRGLRCGGPASHPAGRRAPCPGGSHPAAPPRRPGFCRQDDGERLSHDPDRRLHQRHAVGVGAASMPKPQSAEVQRHTFAVLVENQFGVLGRITGLFSARGFNIESLSVAETDDPSVSRITLVTAGDDMILEQVNKQLNRLIDVIKVTDLSEESHVDREMVLIKVNTEDFRRAEVFRVAEIFRAKIVDVTPKTYVLEVTGDEGKIRAVIDLLKPLGIKEMVRTGKIAIGRGQGAM